MEGARNKQKGIASKIRPGDKLVCYVTKLSRWIGLLEVKSEYFINDSPIFMPSNDPFTIRFKVGSEVWLFAGLAVAISCLGLLGLASFVTTQRLKEIGIRKVMGASVSNIAVLLCSQFIVIVLFASVISIPLAWIGMNHWLQGFAFRVDLAWDMFAVPILLLSAVTLCAVGPIVIKGALTSPTQVLKSE